MLIGHEIGKINKISKFLNLPPSPTIILKICLIGKMRSNNKFLIFNFVDKDAFLTNSSLSPLIETTIFKLLAL